MRKYIFLFISFNIPRFVVRHIALLRSLRWCDSTRPVTRNEEFSERAQFFSVSNSFKLPPTHFTRRGEKFLGQPPHAPSQVTGLHNTTGSIYRRIKNMKGHPYFHFGHRTQIKVPRNHSWRCTDGTLKGCKSSVFTFQEIVRYSKFSPRSMLASSLFFWCERGCAVSDVE